MRAFDPRRVGSLECRAWEAYYRRRWAAFLLASVRLVRAAFGMGRPRSLAGAWLVLRANKAWAPADNRPDKARALMTRFYRLLREDADAEFDPARAAELEVEWWRVHRERRRGRDGSTDPLIRALSDLYAYVYDALPAEVEGAARLRAAAMDLSDAWVDDGCDRSDPRLDRERALLVRSYAALLAAVHR